jgi:hypothetical protein
VSRTPFSVQASAEIGAPAAGVYRLIADYHHGHTRIVPPKYFSDLRVESGSGWGAGTVITYRMRALGSTTHARAAVTEPEPGRVLVETDEQNHTVTTFVVDPLGVARSRLTISTALPTHSGIRGWLERSFIRSYLRKVYAAELALVAYEAARSAR